MKKLPVLFACLFVFCSISFAQNCPETARIFPPVLSETARKTYEAKLAEAKTDYEKSPGSADAIIWLGRRTAYLGNYREAIQIFTRGIKKFPNDARFFRHRGHRLITIRCFDDAVRDFEKAAVLVRGKADEIEPDGLPNARNIPTSTLQSNIFYHLGLAYYLKGDFKNALRVYRQAEKVSANPDMLVATTHWLYMTLRRLGKREEAEKILAPFDKNFQVIENDDYLKLIRLYREEIKPEDFIKSFDDEAKTLSNASLAYGWGNWHLYNRRPEDALRVFKFIKGGDQWASFGYIAAEAELARQ